MIEENKENQKEFVWMNPNELRRAAEHESMLSNAAKVAQDAVSNRALARINPVVAIKRKIDLGITIEVIDGWPTVLAAQLAGIEKIFVCLISGLNDEEILKLMIDLQLGKHSNLLTIYKMIVALYPFFSKGQGHRSDLVPNADEPDTDEAKANIYQKIAGALGGLKITGNTVKWIYKIGNVHPAHFETIEAGRSNLFSAYSACLMEERGIGPKPPSVSAPVYFTTTTESPEFTEPTTTAKPMSAQGEDSSTLNKEESNQSENNQGHNKSHANTTATEWTVFCIDETYIYLRGNCQVCGEEMEVKINKNRVI